MCPYASPLRLWLRRGWDAGDRTVILIDMEKLVEETLSKYDFTYLEKYLVYGQKYRTGIWDMNADFDASLDMTGLLLGSTAESAPITLDGTLGASWPAARRWTPLWA